MFKKILSAALALTMAMSMAVAGSAATVKKPAKKTTTSTKAVQSYDFCRDVLKNDPLALSMHDALVKGLRAKKDTIKLSFEGYTKDQALKAFPKAMQLVIDEHPEIFWMSVMQNVVVGKTSLTFYPRPVHEYGTPSADGTRPSIIDVKAINATTAKMNKKVKGMTGKNDYEVIKDIHDTIVNGTKYPAHPEKADHVHHQAAGPLVNKEAVCDGYAKAFKYACDQKGIPCIIVNGKATNSIGEKGTHAWNYVKMKDGKWYQVDTDWDDPQTKGGNSKNRLSHTYFMVGKLANDRRIPDANRPYPTLAAKAYKA